MFPIRCFSCNKVVGRYELRYNEMVAKGMTPAQVLNKLNIRRYCCRRMFLGHTPITEKILNYQSADCILNSKK